jgi:hypothetical protein
MKKLTLINEKPQNNRKSKNLSIIKYSCLLELNLSKAHDDYIEQFLVDTKTCLPNKVHLHIDYRPLKRVTNKFTRDATRFNCAKLHCLVLDKKFPIYQRLRDYFPQTKIF